MKIPVPYLFPAIFLVFIFSGALAQAPVISYTPATNVYTAGTTITTLTPTNTGGAVSTGALTTFSTDPTGQPYGIAYDPTTGDIITNSFSGNAVYRYSPSGVLLNTYTTSISGPKDIVVDNSGNIYVGNSGAADVVKITPAGVTTTITTGFTAGTSQPDGMAIDAAGNIYVADQGTDKVYKIAPGATTATVYATGFTDLYGITVASTGVVYVSEYTPQADIKQISTTGVVSVFISKAAGGFTDLRNLDIDASDNLFVANYGASTINEITPGKVISTVVTGLNQPRATAEDVFGNLYIANSGDGDILESSPSKYSINIPLPTGMSFDTNTGKISGTPTVTSPTTVYTIVGHNASGSGYTTETITVDPTAPTGTGDSNCGPGTVFLSAAGGTPAGGTYNWYAASVGGASLATGSTYSPAIGATTTYYVDYAQGGVTCAARTAVTGTISANPIISTAPTVGAYFSYGFTGGSVTDLTGGGNNGTLQGAPSTTADRYGTASNAFSFVSASNQYISTTTSAASPATFSISAWFKTSGTVGGYITGFGSSKTGNSATVDRVIYMGTDNKLYFGVKKGNVTNTTINTTSTYNDGNWHHVVATFSAANGSNMYVDGSLAASNPALNSAATIATGYWRIAYDAITGGWTNAPTSAANTYFNGSLDDVAVANTELTSAQVDVYYGAGCSNFCLGNTLSLTANTVAGATYSWVGPAGSGFASASQNPTVPAANAIAGTYVLTVTGAAGCTSTINVAAPGNTITYTWSGAAGTTNPTTAGNWDNLPLFTSTSNLVIPTGLAHYPVLTANETVYGLTVASGASLTLGGFTLNVGCNIINNASAGGTGILYGANNSSAVNWNGSVAAQSYTGTNTANTAQIGTMTVNNSAAGTVTINGGPIDIYSTLTMTQGNLTVAAAPAALNLKSTALLSASVAAIPAACTISGTVNVERYITGGAGYRGYRLVSSPVYAAYVTADTTNVYSINYLQTYTYLTGSAGGGFDKTGNPTLYLYREDIAPSNASFISGNFWGISKINNATAYNYYMNGGATVYNIPVGDGVMFFFRGNRASAAVGVETQPSYTIPVTVTTIASGTLNQGQVFVHDWYTPMSKYLGWTNATANTVVRGFNLVGNPYASSIDWEQYNTATTTTGIYANNVGTTIYELNPATNNYDTYQKGGAFTNHGTKTIVSGQGFFVLAANNSNPQLIFNETAKTATENTGLNLFMDTRANVVSLNNAGIEQHLRLQLAKDSINTDDIYVGFNSTAKSQYVFNEDAPYKSGNGKVSLASISSDNVQLAINRLSLPGQGQTIIPLYVSAQAYGTYKLNMTELASIPQLYEVWLMDAYKKDSLDMRQNPSYAFDLTADTNSYGSKRFSLVIKQNPALAVHLLNFTANKATNGAQVIWKTENEQNYTNFTIERSTDNGVTFDVLGGFASSGLSTYSFLDKNPGPVTDQYRLKIEDLNGTISYSKIVTLDYSNSSNSTNNSNFSIYPNPASSVINLSINQNSNPSSNLIPSPGLASFSSLSAIESVNSKSSLALAPDNAALSYSIKIISITGSVIKTATSTQPNWQDNISSLLPGTYLIEVVNNNDKSLVGKTKFVKL